MDTLAVYLGFSVLFITIVSIAFIGYGVNKNDAPISIFGVIIFIITVIIFGFSVEEYHQPKAIEVYQGKTTLEYTVKDGVVIDSAVVYKGKNR